MGTVLDVLACVAIALTVFVVNASVGVIAHKLATLYDYQSKLKPGDLVIFAFGMGWVLLAGVLFMCTVLRSQGLHWHDEKHEHTGVHWHNATPGRSKRPAKLEDFMRGAKVIEGEWRPVVPEQKGEDKEGNGRTQGQ